MKSPANFLKPLLAGTVALLAILTFSRLQPASASAGVVSQATESADITQLTIRMLEESQFSHRRLDEKLAAQWLKSFTDALDSSHLLFLQSDMDEFTPLQSSLASAIRQKGDSPAARQIFQRYLERLGQRAEFATHELKTASFDFTGQDHLLVKREDAARPKDLNDAQALWLQHLRAEYLQEKLNGAKPEDIQRTLEHRYTRQFETMKKTDSDARLEMFLDSLAHVYDPHSDYFDREDLESFNIAMNLSLVGVGATLEAKDGYPTIIGLVPGGPAARSGQLNVGDRIAAVVPADGQTPVELLDLPLPQAVELIRGKKGSSVCLSILPAGTPDDSARKTVTIRRDEIKLEDQQAKARIVDFPASHGATRRLGVIDLPSFYSSADEKSSKSATADVALLIHKLKEEDVTGIVLDLRQNGGGSLTEAINMTGLFVGRGPVVQTRDMAGRVDVQKAKRGAALYSGPLIVLTSRFSASASEILAGALQDYGRGVIVGDSSTFGKGTVQSLVTLAPLFHNEGVQLPEDPGALKITISKFYLPSGNSTQIKGVKSDVVVPSYSDIKEVGESELKNALPWDSVAPAKYTRMDLVQPYVDALRDLSAVRISKDQGFTYLREDLARGEKIREETTISLNEAARRQELAESDAQTKAHKAERMLHPPPTIPVHEITVQNASKPGLPPPVVEPPHYSATAAANPGAHSAADSPSKDDDAQMREAESILCDYVDLLAQHKAGMVTRR